jgi:hypothetical protein
MTRVFDPRFGGAVGTTVGAPWSTARATSASAPETTSSCRSESSLT